MTQPRKSKPEVLYRGLFEKLSDFVERADAAPPPSWLLDGIVPGEGSMEIVAEPNAGKTWLALALAKKAMELKRSVFLVEEEGGLRPLGNRLRAMGIRPGPGQFLYVAHRRGVLLEDASILDALRQCVAESTAPVMILDSFSSVTSGDENDAEDAQKIIRQFDTIVKANQLALLVVLHHMSKAGARGEGSALYAARGHSKFGAWFDTQLNLKRRTVPKGAGQVAFLLENPKQREEEQAARKRVTITLGTGEIEMADDSEEAGAEQRHRAIDAITSSLTPLMSKNALSKAMGGRKESNLKAIDALVGAGHVRNDPVRGWEVVPNGSQVVPGPPRSGSPPFRGTEGGLGNGPVA